MGEFISECSNSLNEFYRDIFKYTIVRIENIKDCEKTIVLKNGKKIKIDEKHCTEFNGTIMMEEYAIKENKIVGWLARNKHTDYISISILNEKRNFIFPFHLLQKVWVDNYKKWLLAFGQREVEVNVIGELYHSTFIPVPLNELLSSLNKAMCNSLYEENYSPDIIKQEALNFTRDVDEFIANFAEAFELKNFNDEAKQVITKGFALLAIDKILNVTKEHHSYWVSVKKEIGEI